MQYLFLVNWKTDKKEKLGEFFHEFKYKQECQCDLNPRLSLDGTKVFFDTVHDGKRKLCMMDIKDIEL